MWKWVCYLYVYLCIFSLSGARDVWSFYNFHARICMYEIKIKLVCMSVFFQFYKSTHFPDIKIMRRCVLTAPSVLFELCIQTSENRWAIRAFGNFGWKLQNYLTTLTSWTAVRSWLSCLPPDTWHQARVANRTYTGWSWVKIRKPQLHLFVETSASQWMLPTYCPTFPFCHLQSWATTTELL